MIKILNLSYNKHIQFQHILPLEVDEKSKNGGQIIENN